jgi:hypothetical protein
VSHVVGIDGIEALQSNVSDAAGNMSHDGLIAWLESRGMGSLEALVAQHEGWHDLENRRHGMNRNHGGAASRFLSSSSKAALTDRHLLLDDLDPQHTGIITVGGFVSRLERFRARKVLEGVNVGLTAKEEVEQPPPDDNYDTPYPRSKGRGEGGNQDQIWSDRTQVRYYANLDEGRIGRLEGLMQSMSRREQELTLALAEAESNAANVNESISRVYRSKG